MRLIMLKQRILETYNYPVLRILTLLMEREMCVCEIEVCLDMTQSNASRQMMLFLRKQSG